MHLLLLTNQVKLLLGIYDHLLDLIELNVAVEQTLFLDPIAFSAGS